MDISSFAAAASIQSAGQTQSAVELAVLRKAIDIQAAGALALLQAIPTPPAPVGTEGGFVDTWA
ncbi:MAG: YjfB family protein [Candidatus Accumulibacter sp.]|jgi:redox-regulated HSP33 family molecular chaperone|nr:YjfB family protein [Accumulibacter sp.]